jgi:hypothetical protein
MFFSTFPRLDHWDLCPMRAPAPPEGGWLVLPGLSGGHRLVLLGLPMCWCGLIGAHTHYRTVQTDTSAASGVAPRSKQQRTVRLASGTRHNKPLEYIPRKKITAWNCTSATKDFKSKGKGTKAAITGASQPFRSNQVQVQPSLEPTHPPEQVIRDPIR